MTVVKPDNIPLGQKIIPNPLHRYVWHESPVKTQIMKKKKFSKNQNPGLLKPLELFQRDFVFFILCISTMFFCVCKIQPGLRDIFELRDYVSK